MLVIKGKVRYNRHMTKNTQTCNNCGNKFTPKKDDIFSHKIICGDARDDKIISKLMGDKKAGMIFCDPPFNVKIDGHVSGLGKEKHEEFEMASGEMSESEFIEFLTQSFQILKEFSKNGSIHYICMDWRHIYEIITAGKAVYDEFKNLCVWNKDNGGMGTFYRSKHELVFVFKNGTEKHINNFGLGETGRYRTNIWDYPAANSFANESREKLKTASGRVVAGQSEEIKLHPTCKPVAMVSDAILDCSNEKDIILDSYLGSGTTLISAHKTGRIGYGSEISPAYVDTSIIRFMKLTGQKVIHADTGEEFQYNQ